MMILEFVVGFLAGYGLMALIKDFVRYLDG